MTLTSNWKENEVFALFVHNKTWHSNTSHTKNMSFEGFYKWLIADNVMWVKLKYMTILHTQSENVKDCPYLSAITHNPIWIYWLFTIQREI